MSQTEDFNGFITPDGELVSIEDVDRMLSVISQRTENRDKIVGMLYGLVRECGDEGLFSTAADYCERIFALMDTPSEKAECLLTMGQSPGVIL